MGLGTAKEEWQGAVARLDSRKSVDGRAGVLLTWSGIAENPGKRARGRVETPHTPSIYIPDN